MEYLDVSWAVRDCENGDTITVEFNDGSYKCVEFVETDSYGECLVARDDGKVITLQAFELSDVTVGEDY